jgi:hypothetical protein
MTVIPPRVGRHVDYFVDGQMHAAIICGVVDERTVNLAWFRASGLAMQATSVRLVQESEVVPDGPYCAWMPYQVGQAKKHEASST